MANFYDSFAVNSGPVPLGLSEKKGDRGRRELGWLEKRERK